jgi:hypothetical protein
VRYKNPNMLRKTLEQQLEESFRYLPNPFAKLAFLTTVRDPYTGRYMHEGWCTVGAVDEIHETLRRAHRNVFEYICTLPLLELCGHMTSYFRTLAAPSADTMRLWRELECYREMMPQGSCVAEREFFVSQMRTALNAVITAPEWIQKRLAASRFLPPDQQFRRHLDN